MRWFKDLLAALKNRWSGTQAHVVEYHHKPRNAMEVLKAPPSLRYARTYILVHPDDCDPPHGLDLAGKHDAEKVERLRQAFATAGFDPNEPAIVGYPLNGRIQLLTGTHRHLAAKLAGINLPVTIRLSSDVQETWGTELWAEVIRDIPVNELECSIIASGPSRSPYDAVDLNERGNEDGKANH